MKLPSLYRSQLWRNRLLHYLVASFFVVGIMTLSPQANGGLLGCVKVRAQSGTCTTYNPPLKDSFTSLSFNADTYIDSQSPTAVHGSDAKVVLGNLDSVDALDGQNEKYALVRFDATNIPTDISTVYIRFPLRKVSTSNDQAGDDLVLSANRLTIDFSENGVVDDPKTGEAIVIGGSNWTNRPSEDAGSGYATSVNYPAKLLSNLYDSYIDLPITAYVKAVKAGTIQNNGLVVRASMINYFGDVRPLEVQFNARPTQGLAPWPTIFWYRNVAGTGSGSPTPAPSGPGAYSPPSITSPNPSPSAGTPLTSPVPTTSPNFPPTYISPSPAATVSPNFPPSYFSPSPVVQQSPNFPPTYFSPSPVVTYSFIPPIITPPN